MLISKPRGHWLRQEVQQRRVHVDWIPTSGMPADGLTKALPRQRHEEFVSMLNLVNVNHLIQVEESKMDGCIFFSIFVIVSCKRSLIYAHRWEGQLKWYLGQSTPQFV